MFSIKKMKTERLEFFNQQSRVCKEQKQIQLICLFFVNQFWQIVVDSSGKKWNTEKIALKIPLKIQSHNRGMSSAVKFLWPSQ